MPRGDVFRRAASGTSTRSTRQTWRPTRTRRRTRSCSSFRSGFWGMARFAPRAQDGELRADRCARALDDGSERVGCARTHRGRPTRLRSRRSSPSPSPGAGPLVAICMATYEPPHGAVPAPARLDPGPDASQLGLRHLRRLLEPRALRGDRGGGRGRSALHRLALAEAAALLPQLRARAGAGPGRGDATSRWPIRTTSGTPTSSRSLLAALGRRPARRTATQRIVSTGGRAGRRHLLEPPAPEPRRACCRCSWPTR